MKRVFVLLGLFLFSWGTFTGVRKLNAIAQNIEHSGGNAPAQDKPTRIDPPAVKDPVKKENEVVRKVKNPETIFEEADYLVKIRIFKKIVIPVTEQTIYQDTKGFGSGFITDDKDICKKSKYCVVTAFHVVDDSSMTYFSESKDGSQAQLLELVHGTTNYDFAILRFADDKYIPKKTAVIGRSSSLKPGTRIHTMGSNSYGDFWFSPSGHLYVTVKGGNSELKKRLANSGLDHPELILFHTPVFRGFSGGPLVNKYGEVVGITVGFTGLDAEPVYIGSPIDGIKKTLKKIK